MRTQNLKHKKHIQKQNRTQKPQKWKLTNLKLLPVQATERLHN